MKNGLLAIVFISLLTETSVHAANKIAIVNMNTLFQQISQKTGISESLENEFKDRVNELQRMEDDLQSKILHLHRDGSTMKANERNELEKDVMAQRQIFSQRAQSFEYDRRIRSNEEHEKLTARIHAAVKKIADQDDINLVIDSNAVAFNSENIKNITSDVLKQVSQ